MRPVSAVAVCLEAVGSGQIWGCAVNLFSFWKEVGGSEERKSHKMSNPAVAV